MNLNINTNIAQEQEDTSFVPLDLPQAETLPENMEVARWTSEYRDNVSFSNKFSEQEYILVVSLRRRKVYYVIPKTTDNQLIIKLDLKFAFLPISA